MYHGSEEELRAAEMAGRVFDNLCTATPPELHGIHQVHTGHIGGATLDGENETLYSSHNTSVQQPTRRRAARPHHSGVNFVVEIARRESVLRQLYNDKLRGSISAIFSAILSELPRDHIFLQLLHDQSTEQYCRVRVGEVVESFLFSVQAHQYHNLASELAKREVELLSLTAQLEALEQQQQQRQTSPQLQSFKSTQTENRIDSGINTENNERSTRRAVDEEAAAAQDELIALLEEVTREHELAKCRECLSAPTSLLETVEAEEMYRDKFEYLADVVTHLFRSVKGLVLYAEGSLDSLDTLRHGLHTVCRDNNNNDDKCEKNSSNTELSPLRPSLRGVISEQTSSPASQQQRSVLFEEERARLDALAAQLKYAQRHCNDLIQGLAKGQEDVRRQNDALQQQIQHLTMGNNTKELSRALKANEAALTQLRDDLQLSFAAERAEAQGREQELQRCCTQQTAKLQQATESLTVVRQQLQTEIERRKLLEEKISELEDLVAQLQKDRENAQADMQRTVESSKDAMRMQLRTAELELVVRRADVVRARQECIVLDACAAKMELLAAHGYERAAAEQYYTLLLAKENVRHAQSQAAAAQDALREREETGRQCYEDLCRLLECMWEDERTAEAWRYDGEADTEVRSRRRAPHTAAIISSSAVAAATTTTTCSIINGRESSHADDVDDGNSGIDIEKEGGETDSQQRPVGKILVCRYSMPKTLTGITTGLQNAYEAVRRGQHHLQRVADAAKENVQQLQQEDARLRSRLERLASDYEQQRANFKRHWDEQAAWARQGTLKDLLTKQEALLTEVNSEREALRMRWSALSEEYQALERRNSQLHERCTAKEVENARLVGFLRAKHATAPPSSSSSSSSSSLSSHHGGGNTTSILSQPACTTRSLSLHQMKTTGTSAAWHSSADVTKTPQSIGRDVEATVVVDESSPEAHHATTPMWKRLASQASSSAAGLSGPARTSCGSVMDEEVGISAATAHACNVTVEGILPLSQLRRDRGMERVVFSDEHASEAAAVEAAMRRRREAGGGKGTAVEAAAVGATR